MLLPVIVFVLVAGAVVGGYALMTRLPDQLAGRRLERRLRDLARPEDAPDSSIVTQQPREWLPAVDRLVGRMASGSWLQTLIEQSGVRTSPSAVLMISVGSGLICALAAVVYGRQLPVAALIAGLIGLSLPILWLRRRRSVRMKKFEEQFPEALDLLSRALRAGHAFQTAMGMCADELPSPVGVEFKKAFEQQTFGLPLKDALSQLSDRVPLMDVRFFVTAVAIQRETGGNLAEILDNLASVVRERFKILRQVRVHTAHGRFTGYVLLALPAALGIVLSYLSPDHMKTLFEVPMGRTMILGAMVMQTIGFIWIRRVIKIEV
jgi:tight adherence protein B